jgi:hypothetical protein
LDRAVAHTLCGRAASLQRCAEFSPVMAYHCPLRRTNHYSDSMIVTVTPGRAVTRARRGGPRRPPSPLPITMTRAVTRDEPESTPPGGPPMCSSSSPSQVNSAACRSACHGPPARGATARHGESDDPATLCLRPTGLPSAPEGPGPGAQASSHESGNRRGIQVQLEVQVSGSDRLGVVTVTVTVRALAAVSP